MLAPQTFYEVSSNRLGEQMGRVDALDGKAASAMAFAAALLPVFGAILALSEKSKPPTAIGLYVASMIVYVVLLFSVVAAYRVTNWSLRPDLETLKANSDNHHEDAMRAWVANECVASIGCNEPRLKRKSRYTSVALGLLALDALLLALAALITIV